MAGLSLEQKASLLSGGDFWHTKEIDPADTTGGVGVESIMLTDGPNGIRKQPSGGDALGLGKSLPSTCFPPAVGIGASWDVDLIERVGSALGHEAIAENVRVVLGPGINIKRSLLCGRNFEYYSEDPVIAGRAGAAMVRGLQSTGVGSCAKHFAANNQETDRLRVSADVDERPLREIYLRAFEHIVTTASPTALMCSYNRINGVYSSENHWLLTEVLRDEWGFRGLVMSDWGAVNVRVKGVAAGLDLEMPGTDGRTNDQIVAAVNNGTLDEKYVDASARRVVELVAATAGSRDNAPATSTSSDPDEVVKGFDVRAHHALAREAASRSIVLLKNTPAGRQLGTGPGHRGADQNILPLSTHLSVAVVGRFARDPRYQGAGSSQVNPTRVDNAFDAMTVVAGNKVTFLEDADAAQAGDHDVAVVFLGLPPELESEGYDRDGWEIPDDQLDLLDRVHEANDAVVVVLSHGGVVDLGRVEPLATAILDGSLLGQAGGTATSDVLYGGTNPSGRLTETIPLRIEDSPAFLNFPGDPGHTRYGEGIYVGYRWYDARDLAVRYPFGHGLSYTTFGYGSPSASEGKDSKGKDAIRVEVEVTNTGDLRGREVVQVYASIAKSEVARPVRWLVGFTVVDIEAGGSTTATVEIPTTELAYWDRRTDSWVLEGGDYTFAAASSSRDLRGEVTVHIDGDDTAVPITKESTVAELLARPKGRDALMSAFSDKGSDNGSNPVASLMQNESEFKMVESVPLGRVASMAQLSDDALNTMISTANES